MSLIDSISLEFWAKSVEDTGAEMQITVWLGGIMITGTAVDRKTLWQEISETTTSPSGGSLSESRITSLGELSLPDPDDLVLNMVRVSVYAPQTMPKAINLPYLLVRPSLVAAWFLGGVSSIRDNS